MSEQPVICNVCAWRQTCNKKFSISGKDMRCAEFVRDVSLKSDTSEENPSGEEEQDS